jgi:hypothetical protein
MSENRHIVSVNNTNTDGENMFEILSSNLYLIIVPTMWACFATYLAWYFTRVKRYSPLTPTEARQLWTIHKHDTDCNGTKWRQVKHGKETVGFECDCGYKHVQKRPMIAHAPATLDNTQVSTFDRLHTSHKSS